MGLTIHYRLLAPADVTRDQAAALVHRMHADAHRFAAAGRIERVLPISSDLEDLDRWACAWCTLPHPTLAHTRVGRAIPPEEGWIFPVELKADSEPLWLGLCRYPERVTTPEGHLRATRLGARWRFAHGCKTQYASLHGWEHFVRCHSAALDLLAQWREAGVKVRINDEGGYWPHRDLATLRARLDQMNGIVAALAGALKDVADESDGPPLESPIFAHPQFERLEAEGLTRNAAHIDEAVKAVTARSKK